MIAMINCGSQNAQPPAVTSGWGLKLSQSAPGGGANEHRRWVHFQHPLGRNARGVSTVVNYTIAAIPTLYRGRMYRSRLEARWAAFFDRLGWTHEYEPFDLGGWSPDFAISDPFNGLIEIKPLTEPEPELFERVQGAATGRGLVLVTRVAPIVIGSMVFIGWWAASYQDVAVVWTAADKQPVFIADFFSFTSDGETWVSGTMGHGTDEKWPRAYGYADHTMKLWADACNVVQWDGGQ